MFGLAESECGIAGETEFFSAFNLGTAEIP
jgi:hypothetical protein